MADKVALSHVAFEVTPRCKYLCRYCYNHWRREGEVEPAEAPRRVAMGTLRRLFGQADFRGISFTGGEPSLAPWTPELVLMARLRGKQVNIISNGSADPAWYSELARLGIGNFELPFHSAEAAVHDALTCVPGSHGRSARAIGELAAAGKSVVAVIVLTAENAARVRVTLGEIKRLGARAAMLARFNPGGRGVAQMQQLLPALAALKGAFAEADAFARAEKFPVTANVCVPRCVLEPADYPRVAISSCGASPAARPITVDAAGGVRMCNHSPVEMGNLRERRLAGILATPYVEEWGTKPAFCKDCARWLDCRGGCRAAGEQLGTGLGGADPILGAYAIVPPRGAEGRGTIRSETARA